MSNMDVTNSSAVQSYGLYSTQTTGTNSKGTDKNQSTQTQSSEPNFGDASNVNISTEGMNALQSVDKAQETKGLPDDQIRALNDEVALHEQTMLNLMIQALTEHNQKRQVWADEGVEKLNFGDTQIDVSSLGLPEVATTPEEAAKAVGEGGDWSVDAVATRVFDLANAIAGGDPETFRNACCRRGRFQTGGTYVEGRNRRRRYATNHKGHLRRNHASLRRTRSRTQSYRSRRIILSGSSLTEHRSKNLSSNAAGGFFATKCFIRGLWKIFLLCCKISALLLSL